MHNYNMMINLWLFQEKNLVKYYLGQWVIQPTTSL